MKRFELWKLGLQNVLASSLRSVLTVAGMAIGVAAVLAVITLGEAGKTQVKDEIGRLGIDRVIVTQAEDAGLTETDGALLKQRLETDVDELVCLPTELSLRSATVRGTLVGCTRTFFEGTTPAYAAGRGMNAGEWLTSARSAVVGSQIASALNLQPGEWFSASGLMLCCTGIISSCQTAAQIDFASAVVVPLRLLLPLTNGGLQQLSVQVPPGTTPDETAQRAAELVFDYSGKRVNALSMQTQADAANTVLNVFVDVLKWVAFICILVGGIGVTNILLVSVRERRREIGIMQSLGATRIQICGMFLFEALLYAFSGGITGLMLGGILVALAGGSIGISAVIASKDCVLVFAAALGLGLLSGVAPAAKASLLRPIDALRDD